MPDYSSMFGFGDPLVRDDQEVTHENYVEKLGNSCCGMFVGLLIVIGGLMLGGWNEYRCVATERTITAGQDAITQIDCSNYDTANDGKLVFLSCPVTGKQVFGGPFLGGTNIPPSLRLTANVEVYSWIESKSTQEKKDSVGGGTTKVTTYTYNRGWVTTYRSTANFHVTNWCGASYGTCYNVNPANEEGWDRALNLGSNNLGRANAQLGAFDLPGDMVDSLGVQTAVTVSCSGTNTANMSSTPCPADAKAVDKYLYAKFGKVGPLESSYNVRISYNTYNTDKATILAQQKASTFAPWAGPYDPDYTLYMAKNGEVSRDGMIQIARDENYTLTWVLRFFTWVGVWIGFQLITAPLTVVGDIIPCIGPILSGLFGCFLCFFNCLCTTFCWGIIVGAMWVAYRPSVGIPLIVIGTACVVFALIWRMFQSKKGNKNQEMYAMQAQETMPVASFGKFCPHCGGDKGDGAFCASCGKAL